MAHFPIARLILMVIRQISKPISKIIIQRAKRSRIIRKYVALPPAHMYLWIERQVNIKLYGQAPEQSPIYVEKKAIKLGANLLGEAFLFGVAVTFILLEYSRIKGRRIAKEYERGLAKNYLKEKVQSQVIVAEHQEAEIRELRRNIQSINEMVDEKEKKELVGGRSSMFSDPG